MFSIYAVGVVKGYKRETRVQHPHGRRLPARRRRSSSLSSLASAAASASADDADRAGGGPGTADQGPNAITAALQPSVGGQILYFNIE